MKKIIKNIIFSFLLGVEIFCIEVTPVLTETFPLKNTDAVMFTLTQNVDGTRDFVISLLLGTLEKALFLSLLLMMTAVAIVFLVWLLRKRGSLKYGTRPSYGDLLVLLNIICFALLAKCIYSDIPVVDYYVTWKGSITTPGHSEFYQREYVDPDTVKIDFKKKKNLILVFLESMEYNFQDSVNGGNLSKNLIPEITGYLKTEQSFIPGGTQVTGMGWTMADAVAKTCGIPLMFPPSISNSFVPLVSFLPGVTCLTDILVNNDYNIIVSKGANLKFSGMNDFLNTHSVSHAFGFMEYSKDERTQGDMVSEWGVKDSLHFELIKEHLYEISKQGDPWALWFFTVNTHTPHGIVDPTCGIPQDILETERLPAIITCSSRQLDNFIKWAKLQEWYDNTVIAVMGDHAMMAAPELIGFKDSNITHYWLVFFINSTKSAENYQRRFTSLDMFPTILEALGAEIPEGKLGLGRSLYLKSPTLIEKYGTDSLNKVLGKRSVEYDYFLFSEKKRK